MTRGKFWGGPSGSGLGSGSGSGGAPEGVRLRRLYVGFQFFFSLLVWLPIFYEFQKRSGLSDPQIFSIQSVYYLAFCLFEIPTGGLADRYGHVKCMKAGAWLTVATNLIPCFAPSYAGMMLHFLGIAFSRSLVSGAGSAWLYESLAARGAASEFREIEGQARAWGLMGKVVLWLGVGTMMQWRLDLPYWVTVATTALAIPFVYRMIEAPHLRAAGKPRSSWGGAWRELKGRPVLMLLMLQGVGIFVISRIVQMNLFQPILGSKGLSVGLYGAVLSSMTIFEALGSARSKWIRGRLEGESGVFILTVAMAACMLAIPYVNGWGAIALLCIFSAAMGFGIPIQKQLVNDAIPQGGNRATLLSFESILDRGVCSLVAWVLGFYLEKSGVGGFLILSGAGVILLLAGVAVALGRHGRTR